MIDTDFTPSHFSVTVYYVTKDTFKINDTQSIDHYSVIHKHFSYAQDLMMFGLQHKCSPENINEYFINDKLAAMEKAEQLNLQAIEKLQEDYLNKIEL